MSEAATASVNPNVAVGAEPTVSSKSNSSISFDDVSDAQDAPKSTPKPKLVKDDEKETAKKATPGKTKEQVNQFDEADEKPEPKAKPEKDDDAKAAKADDAKPQTKLRKMHKLKHGDSHIEVPGDALMQVMVDGKPEEMTFEEFRSQVSGKIDYSKKYNAFHLEKTEFTKQRDSLNTLVTNLYEKAQKDPTGESAYDFLAEITKQDPAKLKLDIIRKQYEHLKPLFDMPEAEREAWFKDRERDWRDRAYENRTAAEKAREDQTRAEAERSEAVGKFGIDADAYTRAEKLVSDYLKKADPNFNGKVTTEQVIYADRNMLALSVIAEVVPNLEKHPKFDSIVGDLVQDLVRHPEMNREKIGKLLVDAFGSVEDKKGLSNLARKAAKNAQIAEDDPKPASKNPSTDLLSFDDVE